MSRRCSLEFALINVFVVTIALSAIFTYTTIDSVTVRIEDKERVTTGSGESISSKYLIFTDVETFENTDSILFLKFNSSDLYSSLKRGELYTLKVCGWRIPFLSSYRNILNIEPPKTE